MTRAESVRCVYFSGTGNTQYVVQELIKRLEERGHACEVLAADRLWADCGLAPGRAADTEALRQRLERHVSGGDTLLLAFPTHDSDVPRPISDLFELLPPGEGMHLAVVSTILIAGGDCCLLPGRALEKLGYRPAFAGYVKMPNNIHVPHLELFPIHNGDELAGYYHSVAKRLDELVEQMEEGKRRLAGRGVSNHLFGQAQRWTERFAGHLVTRHMHANDDCAACGLCAATCPMGNISYANGRPVFGQECCLCLRCYNFCPQEAVQLGEATQDKARFPRYKGFAGWKPPRLRHIDPPRKRKHKGKRAAEAPRAADQTS